MGWSGDFIIKKNVKKMDFFVDIFFNIPSNIYKDNFICSQYFPYTNKPLNNFLNIFEKYSLFELFKLSFLNIQRKDEKIGNIPSNTNMSNLVNYLLKMNSKKLKYMKENNIDNIVNLLTQGELCINRNKVKNEKEGEKDYMDNEQKDERKRYKRKTLKRIYVAMKYACRHMLKKYLLFRPNNYKEKNYNTKKNMLSSEEIFLNNNKVPLLTDYDFNFSSDTDDEHISYKKK